VGCYSMNTLTGIRNYSRLRICRKIGDPMPKEVMEPWEKLFVKPSREAIFVWGKAQRHQILMRIDGLSLAPSGFV
jgi:hypothetical protein